MYNWRYICRLSLINSTVFDEFWRRRRDSGELTVDGRDAPSGVDVRGRWEEAERKVNQRKKNL